MHGTVANICPDTNSFTASIDQLDISTVLPNSSSKEFMGIISGCPQMRSAFEVLGKVAKTFTTVLISGESGTGKELIARAIHELSGRKGKLVPVNCGAIPEDILESELFGHEKGAFTGAISSRVGRFQLADSGTIFLDEIGEMSPKLQVKLLRVLQERKIEPVGSTRSIELDVRIIAATNKDLRKEVEKGNFREDLYYRLQVVPIHLPPLRERGSDILLLTKYFAEKFHSRFGGKETSFAPETIAKFLSYPWPGNVRELENLVERLVVLSDTGVVREEDLPEYIAAPIGRETQLISTNSAMPADGLDFNSLVNEFETKLITMALRKTNGNKKAAARLLNLNRTTLVEKIKKKGLQEQIEVSRDQVFA
ncbi:MAG: sigma-54-dependent Fis family transcriptional regulator [Bdellovibrionales bacterium]|nr:sigma-54-dependent Fis family transcriptional regulator [Bdellovibrionales bacterium]